ncbi:hypothetical protein AB6A40_007982 [Gnathostoma spinigerum]|uniref:Uncharacterized protein n=1 Tax=Gnathostoma spinigerum TaxID=75299 RepID=A0ABD6EN30_9BILA
MTKTLLHAYINYACAVGKNTDCGQVTVPPSRKRGIQQFHDVITEERAARPSVSKYGRHQNRQAEFRRKKINFENESQARENTVNRAPHFISQGDIIHFDNEKVEIRGQGYKRSVFWPKRLLRCKRKTIGYGGTHSQSIIRLILTLLLYLISANAYRKRNSIL